MKRLYYRDLTSNDTLHTVGRRLSANIIRKEQTCREFLWNNHVALVTQR